MGAERIAFAAKDFSSDQKLTPRYAKTATSVDSLSNLLNQRYIDSFSTDPTLKPHGFRNTLQAKFDAANTPNKTSGYLIGWKNQDTVGMQKEYNKQSYPHLQLYRFSKHVTPWKNGLRRHLIPYRY